MKKNIYYIFLFIILFILFFSINNFFVNKKYNDKNLSKSIFNIISKTNINLDNNIGINGKTDLYKNIEEIQIIGKGFFISNSGDFLTSKHLFNNNLSSYYININNKNYSFNVVKKYKNKDIILGKINNYKNENYLELIENYKNNGINIGEKIYTYKNNQNIIGKITNTDISIKELKLNNLVKTNIKLIPGDSGSPVFNKKGEIVGIFTAIKKGENISFFEKINYK